MLLLWELWPYEFFLIFLNTYTLAEVFSKQFERTWNKIHSIFSTSVIPPLSRDLGFRVKGWVSGFWKKTWKENFQNLKKTRWVNRLSGLNFTDSKIEKKSERGSFVLNQNWRLFSRIFKKEFDVIQNFTFFWLPTPIIVKYVIFLHTLTKKLPCSWIKKIK